jgi:membrane-bound metal-dependent hydrolase YbcI (DUF457 family)
MFNSTHTLTGLVLARAGMDRWAPRATLTAAIAANLPDIDIVFGLPGSVAYIEHHRGITHSVIGIVLLTVMLTAALYPFTKTFWRTFLVALAAMATHPLLDYANTYGVQPLLPFSEKRYFGDTLYVIDPYLDGILLAGLVCGRVLGKRRVLAGITGAAAILYIGARVELRDNARDNLKTFTAGVPGAAGMAVFPNMIELLEFGGIVETPEEFIKVRVNAGFREAPPLRVDEVARFEKGDWSSQIVDHAAMTRTGTVFRGFARFPGVRQEEIAEGYRVTFIDYRFYNEQSGRGFGGEVILDRKLHPMAQSLSFRRKAP